MRWKRFRVSSAVTAPSPMASRAARNASRVTTPAASGSKSLAAYFASDHPAGTFDANFSRATFSSSLASSRFGNLGGVFARTGS